MQLKQITLAEKKLFQNYLAQRHHDLITYNFSNFYMWRNWDPYRWAEVCGALVIKSDFAGWDAVLPPFSPKSQPILEATQALIEWYEERQAPFLMTEVSQTVLAFYEKHWPGRFISTPFPAGFNYIYRQEDLAYLAGQKYASKRNHVHRFMRENPDFIFVPLAPEHIAGCKELEMAWLRYHDITDDAILQEHSGVMDALDHFAELDCVGGCLKVHGKVIGFSIGEPLNEDTFAIHIEKADIAVHGSFQALNQFFARDFCAAYPFINRAEDMGHPGQRKAKMSYHPHHLEKKYHLRLAGNI
ncbi:MAG: phosphatidylglycerol lysyltransferase domain-containing protein [Clostridiales bacterium]|nr:phosphatidylglycerol lysyltransferase domain-containing protein [Clostridiales bacterium]